MKPRRRPTVIACWSTGCGRAASERATWRTTPGSRTLRTNELRKWVHADMSRWDEFARRYCAELAAIPDIVDGLLGVDSPTITLLYSARDESQNHALVLKGFLEGRS